MSEFNKIKWVPEWKRHEQEKQAKKQQLELEAQKGLEKTDDNFPGLVAVPTSIKVWGGDKKFSDLAREWDRDSQEKSEKEKHMAEFEKTRGGTSQFVMPTFNNKRYYVEKPEFIEPEEDKHVPIPDDSVWKVVDHSKVRNRKEKDMEELANRPPTPEEDGTVWPVKGTNETCWDERN